MRKFIFDILGCSVWLIILWLLIVLFLPLKWYPRIGGYIYNPRFLKRYPEIVMFESKMSIMPGQRAILGKPSAIRKNEDGTTTVIWE